MYVNNATVSVTLRDVNENPITGATNVPMVYAAGSNGNYVGALPHNIELTDKARYWLEITALAFSGTFRVFRRIPAVALYHGAEGDCC